MLLGLRNGDNKEEKERRFLIRSIKQQLNYCISRSSKTGQSKHSAKANGTYKHGELYGSKTINAYRDTAKNISNWLSEHHPEIIAVRDITPEIVQEWIDDRSENWSAKTLENHITHIKYLEQQAQKCYGKENIHFYSKDFERPTTKEAVRNQSITEKDFQALRSAMENSRSFAKDALELTYRCGLRVDEVAHLKREDIDLRTGKIYVSPEGAKNGKARTVPIRDKDRFYFEGLLNRYPDNGYLTKIDSKSIDKAIRRYMHNAKDEKGEDLAHKYPKETIHGIRKLYATERMHELRGDNPLPDKKEEMKHWNIVSAELGHGDGRDALYNTYCKG